MRVRPRAAAPRRRRHSRTDRGDRGRWLGAPARAARRVVAGPHRPAWGRAASRPRASPASRLEPEPPRRRAGACAPPRERILSPATSGAAATAFARLGAVPRERRAEADQTIGAGERTLEEIVRDTLRPLLQAWLDDHLPAIVERLVREEIARVVGEAGLR